MSHDEDNGDSSAEDDTVIEVDFGGDGGTDEAAERSSQSESDETEGAAAETVGETIDITDELSQSGPEVHAVFPGQLGDPEAEVKLDVFSDMIGSGVVMVTLDARREDVVVPPRHEGDPRLNLNFSHGFQIPDFSYDSEGVRASLLFDGEDMWCDVPWDAVYMLHSQASDEIVQFPSSMPEEILEAVPELKHVLAELDELGDLDPDKDLEPADDNEDPETDS
jgi:hypothetical protein